MSDSKPQWSYVCERCGHHLEMHAMGCQHINSDASRCDCDLAGPANTTGLPQSELGGLHPELRARITTAKAALSKFQADVDKVLRGELSSLDAHGHAYRLRVELRSLVHAIERLS